VLKKSKKLWAELGRNFYITKASVIPMWKIFIQYFEKIILNILTKLKNILRTIFILNTKHHSDIFTKQKRDCNDNFSFSCILTFLIQSIRFSFIKLNNNMPIEEGYNATSDYVQQSFIVSCCFTSIKYRSLLLQNSKLELRLPNIHL